MKIKIIISIEMFSHFVDVIFFFLNTKNIKKLINEIEKLLTVKKRGNHYPKHHILLMERGLLGHLFSNVKFSTCIMLNLI